MKTSRLLLIALCSLFFVTACVKNNNKPIDKNGLPSATQSGAQTLGFLLNGEVWVPAGTGITKLEASYDPLYNNGVMSVTSRRVSSETDRDYFGFGITDSVNFTKAPVTFELSRNSLLRVIYSSLKEGWDLHSSDDTTYCSGSLTLTKFDKVNDIVSGTFNATLASPHTDTVRITEGRFDVKL